MLASDAVGAPESAADEVLLRRFVEAGDREALGTLLDRHTPSAFRLARRYFQNDADAEDAVQSAFMAVIQSAAKFRGQASPKAFILGFLVNACQHKVRSKARRDTAQRRLKEQSVPQTQSLTQDELQQALLSAVQGLPEHYRTPVWLRYYENLSSRDVALALSMPAATVRTQLSRGVEQLRQSLAVSGYTLSEAALCGLLTSLVTESVPATLVSKVSQIASGQTALVAGAPTAAGAATTLKVVLTAALMVPLATTAGYLALRPGPAPTPAPANQAPVALPQISPAKDSTLIAEWNFEKGPPADIKLLQGRWEWKAAEGGHKGAMFTGSAAFVSLSCQLPASPLVIKLQWRNTQTDKGSLYAFWAAGAKTLPARCWDAVPLPMGSQTTVLYRFPQHSVETVNSKLFLVSRFEKPFIAGDRLCLRLHNAFLESIEIRLLPLDSAPEGFADPDKVVSGLSGESRELKAIKLP